MFIQIRQFSDKDTLDATTSALSSCACAAHHAWSVGKFLTVIIQRLFYIIREFQSVHLVKVREEKRKKQLLRYCKIVKHFSRFHFKITFFLVFYHLLRVEKTDKSCYFFLFGRFYSVGILELFMIWDFFIPRIFSLFHFNQKAFADESDNFLAGVLKKFFDFYGVKVFLKMKFCAMERYRQKSQPQCNLKKVSYSISSGKKTFSFFL